MRRKSAVKILWAVLALALPLEMEAEDPRLAAHVLDRITWGPRPGDLAAVMQRGAENFVRDQLHPEAMDDGACLAKVAAIEEWGLSIGRLMARYPNPQQDASMRQVKKWEPETYAAKAAMDQGEAFRAMHSMLQAQRRQRWIRILHSRRQLEEVMVDFWWNHFNVSFDKGMVRWFALPYERDAIRPHALGRFRDLLAATCKHPAMLFYLDNAMSKSEKDPMMAEKKMAMGEKPLRRNENYAREILELHTLGVDGGYTQTDVLEAARVLTGWGIEGINDRTVAKPVAFRFKPWHHDDTQKTVLGRTFGPGQGQAEGEALLDLLASHPSTARHISRKLCLRFISDNPPETLVEEAAARFIKSGGDIRETLKVILLSDDFLSLKHAGARFKTPLEFAASTLRALEVDARGFEPVDRFLEKNGMGMMTCPPPTGYKVSAEEWLSPSGLLARANFAWELCERPYGGWLRFRPSTVVPGGPEQEPGAALDEAAQNLMGRPLSAEVRAAVLEKISEPGMAQVKVGKGRTGLDLKQVIALVVASPDFQRK